ncbi:MAG: HAD-IIA family hydrolase [Tepidisphaeraceae bacterium]
MPRGQWTTTSSSLHSLAVPMDFSSLDAVLLDLDGTVYHEEHPIPGAVEFIHRLRARETKYACLTNSTSSPARISKRLGNMGIDVDPAHIYTAAAGAADYVMERHGGEPARPARVFNLSTDGLAEMLEGKVHWVQPPGDEPCDVVISGAPGNVYATEDRRRVALKLLRAGAALVGICADRIFPSPRGIEFGAGALGLMLGYAANVEPIFTGKPQPLFFRELCRRLKVAPERCVLIGDNLESDIGGGKSVGMRTILTLTGITRREDAERLPAEKRPDGIIRDLSELM